MSVIDSKNIRQIDGTLLLVLQALLKHRRTTAVAAQLGLSQSGISHALARLRRLFGDELFIRRPHGLEPTKHALALSPQIDALIADAQSLIGPPPGFDPATSRRDFRIASPDMLASLVAPALLPIFLAEAPNARFAFSLMLGDVALRSLRLDEMDLAIGRFAARPEGVRKQPLLEDDYCLVARRGHPALASPLTPETFEALTHVAVSVEGDFRTFTDRDLAARGLKRRFTAAAPRFSIAFAMVARSEAVCIAPRRLALAQDDMGLQTADLPIPLSPIRLEVARRLSPDAGIDWLLGAIARATA